MEAFSEEKNDVFVPQKIFMQRAIELAKRGGGKVHPNPLVGAVIIDVGTTRVPDPTRKSGFRLNGDVKFDEVAPLCSYITPVPGGVGPMTICSLMKNTLAAGKKEYYK